jgi:hypothetical protein
VEDTLLTLVSRVGFWTGGRQSGNYRQEASNKQPSPGKRGGLNGSTQHLDSLWTNQSGCGTGGRSGSRLQQFINAIDEVETGIARIEGMKIGRKKQELQVGIEMMKLLEG